MDKKPPSLRKCAVLPVAAALLAAGLPASADSTDSGARAAGAWYGDSIEAPRLFAGYRSTLGLKALSSSAAALGHASAATRLLARYADVAEIEAPVFYAYQPIPSGPGLRSAAQTSGVVIRGGERWSTSFESSTGTDMLTGSRRTALLTQLQAPLPGGAGVSLGLRYSTWQGQALAMGGGEPIPGNGYGLLPARLDPGVQQFAYQVQFNYLYGERNTVALTYNSRREFEQYPFALDPLASDGRQLSLTGEHWFSPSWAVRYDIADPGNLMRRQGLRLGLQYRF